MTDIYLGVLSGTSMDAIDVAAFDFSQTKPLIASHSCKFPIEYKERYTQIVKTRQATVIELGEMDNWTGELFANTVQEFLSKANLPKNSIRAIGSHGQTIWHAPDAKRAFTWQIGDPSIIAFKTGITTVADFRRADIAAGGKGAPFAPLFHRAMFADAKQNRCVVNIGGICNISVLANNEYFGFDPGPGNCLMDLWMQQNYARDYDLDGKTALTGNTNLELLNQCLQDPYFSKAPPKSTGLEYFNAAWLEKNIQAASAQNLPAEDVLATLLELTSTIIYATMKNLSLLEADLYLCGGGARNTALRNSLAQKLGRVVQTTSDLGIDPQWVEAGLFAWLAKQRLENIQQDLSFFTGSKHPLILGAIYAASF